MEEDRIANETPRPRCFLALPHSREFDSVWESVAVTVREAGFEPVSLRELRPSSLTVSRLLAEELSQADCVVADVTNGSPNIFYELGLAQAMGKAIFVLSQHETREDVPFGLSGVDYLAYKGLRDLRRGLRRTLEAYKGAPGRPRSFLPTGLAPPFAIDWDRLDQAEAENLCLELLAQMGFRQLDWEKRSPEFDLVAELPKKDPDGYEYRELWLVAMGRNAPPEMLLDILNHEPEYLLHRLMRSHDRLGRIDVRREMEVPLTVLLILLSPKQERLDVQDRRLRKGEWPSTIRVRIWDRNHLTSLVQQFPQIGFKYFSDEGRARSKYRKTPEELYKDNLDLTTRLTNTITALEEEKNRRVRAERDAVWKDISFAAAHKIGNPIFAIETNLDPLERRVKENRTDEALAVIKKITVSVEKAKGIVDQFKSLARAQEIHVGTVPLRPLLDQAFETAATQGVDCRVNCPDDILVCGDAERLSESFDELVSNAMHWLDKSEKVITVDAAKPNREALPTSLDSEKDFVLVHFKDNGAGVAFENKSKIFDAFFTTHEHGTGLGLALVRRIIEGHGGAISESGIPGQGADFEIYLPLCPEHTDEQPTSKVNEGRMR